MKKNAIAYDYLWIMQMGVQNDLKVNAALFKLNQSQFTSKLVFHLNITGETGTRFEIGNLPSICIQTRLHCVLENLVSEANFSQ